MYALGKAWEVQKPSSLSRAPGLRSHQDSSKVCWIWPGSTDLGVLLCPGPPSPWRLPGLPSAHTQHSDGRWVVGPSVGHPD